jgi:hypothetical protein
MMVMMHGSWRRLSGHGVVAPMMRRRGRDRTGGRVFVVVMMHYRHGRRGHHRGGQRGD